VIVSEKEICIFRCTLIPHTNDNRLLRGHDEDVGVGLVGIADVVNCGVDRLSDFIQGHRVVHLQMSLSFRLFLIFHCQGFAKGFCRFKSILVLGVEYGLKRRSMC
jgi:hypothetical protein